jgi:glycosyltransferase involved in cell wall biosynthesis
MIDAVPPFVSVIVPVLNEERIIQSCLTALLNVDYPVECWEILVVDNRSTDRTPDIIKNFPVQYLKEERRGCAAARNRAIRVSRGEIIVSTDADCIITRGWLREIVQAFNEEGVGAVAGEVVAYPPCTPAEQYAARVRHTSPQKYLSRPLLPFAAFANLAFRREVFGQIVLLDETIPIGESTDFCTRFLRGTGLKLKYAPKAVVFHRHRKTAWGFFKQQWKYGRGHAQPYIKYRQEIPWKWQKSVSAYRDLARAVWMLTKSVLHIRHWSKDKEDLYFHYFEFLKKFAERLGFIRENLAKGYLYF